MAPSEKGEGAWGDRLAEGRGVKVWTASWKKREGKGGGGMEGETGGGAKDVVTLHPWGSLRYTGFWDHRKLGTTINRNWQKSLGTTSYTCNHKTESHLV